MPAIPHPFDQPYADRDQVALLAVEKTYNRKTIADADAVRNGDWAMQIGGLHLLSNNADYDINTLDATTPADGDAFIRDFNGILFVKQVPSVSKVERPVIANGDIAGLATDQVVVVNKAANENTNYNAVASATLKADELTLKDLRGNASAYRLRFSPIAGEKIDGQDYFDITRDHGWVTVRKKNGGGWYVVSSAE